MPIVNKKKTVTATKKVVAEKPVKKVEVEEAEVEVKVTPTEKKKAKAPTGGRKLSLTGNVKTPKSFEIKEGSQATQEAFIDKFYKKLQALGYDITKEQTKSLKKAYSETLKEVTDLASYQDVDAGIYYARRLIKARVTEPPKAKDGLQTLMADHYELKVRKLIGDESTFKFFGRLNEDGTVFVTVDDEEIPMVTEEEVKPTKKKAATKKAPVVEEVVEEEEIEDEEETVETAVEEDFDDFLDDEDEE